MNMNAHAALQKGHMHTCSLTQATTCYTLLETHELIDAYIFIHTCHMIVLLHSMMSNVCHMLFPSRLPWCNPSGRGSESSSWRLHKLYKDSLNHALPKPGYNRLYTANNNIPLQYWSHKTHVRFYGTRCMHGKVVSVAGTRLLLNKVPWQHKIASLQHSYNK